MLRVAGGNPRPSTLSDNPAGVGHLHPIFLSPTVGFLYERPAPPWGICSFSIAWDQAPPFSLPRLPLGSLPSPIFFFTHAGVFLLFPQCVPGPRLRFQNKMTIARQMPGGVGDEHAWNWLSHDMCRRTVNVKLHAYYSRLPITWSSRYLRPKAKYFT